MGPPPGQEGAPPPPVTPPAAPSEFNTPVVAPHPVDVEGDAAPAAQTIAPDRKPMSTLKLFALVILFAGIAGYVIAMAVGSRGGSALTAPGRPRAVASVCGPPKCHRLQAEVRLSWRSSLGNVAAYTIERDGTPLGGVRLGSSDTTYTDDTAAFGSAHDYVVVAHDGSDEVASTPPIHVKVPVPPLAAAQLDGAYKVRLIVTKAKNLSSLEGFTTPHAGDTRSDTWNFAIRCADTQGACPTRWESLGAIAPQGREYRGSFIAGRAECHPGGGAPNHFAMNLGIRAAHVVDGRWLVSAFAGSYSVSFSCPGGPSTGALRVVGRAA